MTKRMLIMLGTVGLFFGGILVFQLLVKPAMMRKFIPVGVIPPQTVSTAKAGFSEWPNGVGLARDWRRETRSTQLREIREI